MASKKIGNDGLDPINTALFNEVQRRAKQFFIDARINILFYNPDEGDKVLLHYRKMSRKERIAILKGLTEDGTMVAVHKESTGDIDALDIILISRQGIESVMFESTKALIWYKWYWPVESRELRELGYITGDPIIHNLITSHIAEAIGQSLETLAVFVASLIQSAEDGGFALPSENESNHEKSERFSP